MPRSAPRLLLDVGHAVALLERRGERELVPLPAQEQGPLLVRVTQQEGLGLVRQVDSLKQGGGPFAKGVIGFFRLVINVLISEMSPFL